MTRGRKQQEGIRPRGRARERRRTLERILQEQRRLVEEAPAPRPSGGDPVDVGQEQEEEMVWLAVMDRSHALVGQVDEALRRLVHGEYGLRIDCGERISVARLRALPFAL